MQLNQLADAWQYGLWTSRVGQNSLNHKTRLNHFYGLLMFVPKGGHWDRYFHKDGNVTKIRRIDLSPAELEQELAVWRRHARWTGTWPAFIIAIISAALGGVLFFEGHLAIGGFVAAIGFFLGMALLVKKLRGNTTRSNELLNKIGLADT